MCLSVWLKVSVRYVEILTDSPTLLLKKQYECGTIYFRKEDKYICQIFEIDVIFQFSAYQGNNVLLFSRKNKQTPDMKDTDATPFLIISWNIGEELTSVNMDFIWLMELWNTVMNDVIGRFLGQPSKCLGDLCVSLLPLLLPRGRLQDSHGEVMTTRGCHCYTGSLEENGEACFLQLVLCKINVLQH